MIRFLRGDSQAPKGHAIFFARSNRDTQTVLATYCVVPPTPLSLAKYLPSFLASQLPAEDLQEATNIPVMPIPPMLEEGSSMEQLEVLAERRNDDLVDLGTIDPRDNAARMQMVQEACQEYGQFYANYAASFRSFSAPPPIEERLPDEELDAEELLVRTMSERQRLGELSRLVGMARYALDGHDEMSLQETKQRMQRIGQHMPEKYRTTELISAAIEPDERGARLAQLYLERGYKLLDEEYADIPGIERSIRELLP